MSYFVDMNVKKSVSSMKQF